ncbi:MAG: 2-oxoacid:acceptor oxidoreductase family protein, partial [Candidatus Methylomirabilota bacterium]
LGGQGVLFLTRVLAEAAVLAGAEALTSETHGMAQRGGAVVSTVKVGLFHGPLVASGEAEAGLFLVPENLAVHGHFLRPDAAVFVNGTRPTGHPTLDAEALAAAAGAPRSGNLTLLGFAAGRGGLFLGPDAFEAAIRRVTPERVLTQNLAAFRAGVAAAP